MTPADGENYLATEQLISQFFALVLYGFSGIISSLVVFIVCSRETGDTFNRFPPIILAREKSKDRLLLSRASISRMTVVV